MRIKSVNICNVISTLLGIKQTLYIKYIKNIKYILSSSENQDMFPENLSLHFLVVQSFFLYQSGFQKKEEEKLVSAALPPLPQSDHSLRVRAQEQEETVFCQLQLRYTPPPTLQSRGMAGSHQMTVIFNTVSLGRNAPVDLSSLEYICFTISSPPWFQEDHTQVCSLLIP